MISQYQVGQRPRLPLSITVYGEGNQILDLSIYDNFNVRLIDGRDRDVDMTGSVLRTTGARFGRFVLEWPADRSLFQTPGDYLLQLELTGAGKRDFTTTHTIRVRGVGRTR